MIRLSRQQRAAYSSQGLKFCYGCEHPRPILDFSVNRAKRDGRACRCRECVSTKLRSQTQTCLDCGGARSWASAVRCRECYKRRAIERAEFRFFQTPFYYDRRAVQLIRNHHLRWPDVRVKLMLLSEEAAEKVASRASEEEGIYGLYNTYLFRTRAPYSLDKKKYVDRGNRPDSPVTWGDLLPQEYAE